MLIVKEKNHYEIASMAAGLSSAGAEEWTAPKKMTKNEVPPQNFPIFPLLHVWDSRFVLKPSPGDQILETTGILAN